MSGAKRVNFLPPPSMTLSRPAVLKWPTKVVKLSVKAKSIRSGSFTVEPAVAAATKQAQLLKSAAVKMCFILCSAVLQCRMAAARVMQVIPTAETITNTVTKFEVKL